MQFRNDRANKDCEVMGVFVPKHRQNTEKDRKWKDFHFLSIYE